MRIVLALMMLTAVGCRSVSNEKVLRDHNVMLMRALEKEREDRATERKAWQELTKETNDSHEKFLRDIDEYTAEIERLRAENAMLKKRPN